MEVGISYIYNNFDKDEREMNDISVQVPSDCIHFHLEKKPQIKIKKTYLTKHYGVLEGI